MINGNYKQAEEQLSFIKNDQQKTLGLTAIYMQKKQFEQAKNENKKVKNNDVRNYNSALIALKEGDNEVFRQTKNNVKDEALQYILSTEEAYKNGDFNEAERLGKLAISKNAGIFRFILVKSLEREQKNPKRETFF